MGRAFLEIKAERLRAEEAVARVQHQLTGLMDLARDILAHRNDLASLKRQLKSVNEALWNIEDEIRAKEAAKSFDQQFIKLARSVFVHNDKRGDLKRRIDMLLNSELVEVKQYTAY